MQRRVHSQGPTHSHKQAIQYPHHMLMLMAMSHLQTLKSCPDGWLSTYQLLESS